MQRVFIHGRNTEADESRAIQSTIAARPGDVSAPGPNVQAQVGYPGRHEILHCISGIAWSYDGEPTGGNLQVAYGANVVLNLDIVCAGPGFIPFVPPKTGYQGLQLTITLAAGGAGVSGKLSILGHWTE